MVAKRLKGHYLRSYEQFQKNSDFKGDFHAKSEHKKSYILGYFLVTQKSKKVDQKMGYQPQKVKKKRNSKNGAKTGQRPLFKEL